MNFHEWEPVYEAILTDFGYDRKRDKQARDLLADLTTPFVLDRLPGTGQTIAIAGGAETLESELDLVREADVVVSVSQATDTLLDAGIAVDCMVTDLDKNPQTAHNLTHDHVPVVVHAHGDNITMLHEFVPEFVGEYVVATTQAGPQDGVWNVGGFTDGDRAAFLADHLGATELLFPGWDFDDPTVSKEKHQKLEWAERLLYWLEHRRNDHFHILNGRRDQIDTTTLPL